MDPDNFDLKNNSASNVPNDNEQEVTSERVFDFTEDNISPVTDNEPVSPTKQAGISSNLTHPPKPSTKSYIPPDADLLDKKIGTFDTTPFAPPVKTTQTADIPTIQKTSSDLYTKPIEKSPTPANLPVSDNSQNPQMAGMVGQTVLKPSKPSPIPIKNIQSITDNIHKRSLQDEIASVLPRNLKNQEVKPSISSIITSTPIQVSGSTLSQNPNSTGSEQNNGQEIKPIRTYESDVADVMSHKRTSRASIAIAESNKMEKGETISNQDPSRAGKKIFLTLLSLIFVGGGIIGAYYLYTISPLAPAKIITPQQKIVPSIIPRDSQVVLTIKDSFPIDIQSKIQTEIDKTQAVNTIKEVILVNKDSAGTLMRISGPEMIKIMDIDIPNTVIRSLTADWMLGIYNNTDNKKTVFVIVTTNFFQNTFSGMLQWESVMADDIRQYLYPIAPSGIVNNSFENISTSTKKVDPLADLNSILPGARVSSVATSTIASSIATNTSTSSTTIDLTPPLQPYFTLRGKFEDRIVKNKDVREFRTDTGTTLFLYSFIDNSHLITTGNEATLSEILTRLEKQSLIR